MRNILIELVAKGGVYALGSSLNGLAGFLLIPFFVDHLLPEEYGRFAFAEMILIIFLAFSGLGLRIAFLNKYNQIDKENRRNYVGALFAFVIASTLVFEIIYIFLAFVFSETLFSELSTELILLVGVIAAVETVWVLFSTLYRVKGWAWKFVLVSFMQLTFGLVATVMLIKGYGFREEGILYGRLIGDSVMLIMLTKVFYEYRPKRGSLSLAFDTVKMGLPLVPSVFALTWIMMSPRFSIELFGSYADLGIFALSAKLAGVISLVFVNPFGLIWTVLLFKVSNRVDASLVYSRILTYYVLVGGVIAFSLGVCAPGFIQLFGSDTFNLADDVILIVGLAIILSGMNYVLNTGAWLKGEMKKLLPVYMVSVVVSILLGFILTPIWGVQGACWALLLTYCIQVVLLRWLNNKIYPVPVESKRIVKVICTILFGYLILVNFMNLSPWIELPIFLACIPVLLFVSGFFDEIEKKYIGISCENLYRTLLSKK
jgi:O-antigen/teichoic acid export membrane protein